MRKRVLAVFLALFLVFGLLPGTALAAAQNNAAAGSAPTRVTLPSGVKFVPYSWMPENAGGTYSVSAGTLPSGLDLNAATGEISGVPQTNNTWKFTVRQTVAENGQTLTSDFSCTIVVQINSNSYIPGPDTDVQSTPCGARPTRPTNDYEIIDPIGRAVGDEFILDSYRDETLIIDGPYQEFQRLYIDGKLLVRDQDYKAHEGSTVITIFAQTFEKIGKGTHTVSAEFRSADGKLKTSSQNYTVKLSSSASGPSAAPAVPAPPASAPVPEEPDVTGNLPFGDISSANWFYDDVAWAYDGGIMTGVTANSFAPQTSISQATIVTVLSRMANVDLDKFSGATDDVIASGQWYTEAAIWAKQSGLLPDHNVFTGNETISRDQMAVMLSKYLQSMGKDTAVPDQPVAFADAEDMSQAGNDAFQVLYAYNIFRGTGDGRMDPNGSTTRAQFAALLHRISDTVK